MIRAASIMTAALLVLGGMAVPAGAAPGFGVRISPVANLVYHLDCLSGYRRCTRAAFDELWQRLDWNAEDERLLIRWQQLQERYRLYADFTTSAPEAPYPYTFPYLQARGIDIGEKLRLASLQSRDLADYGERLRLLLQPRDAREAMAVARHFEPRFEVWWRDGAAGDLERLAAGYQGTAQRAGLAALLARVGNLFDLRLQDVADLEVNLVALPEGARASRATLIENHAIVESRRGEAPDDRLGVIVHEFVHYLYALSPRERHEAVLEAFLASERPWSLRAYNLINEAVASAIGNGIVERRLQTEAEYRRYHALPDSFYADFYVDTLAKALVPMLDRHLEDGRPLGAGFAADYLETAARALDGRLDDLALQLVSSAVVATDPALAELARLPASALTTFSLFTHITAEPGLPATALTRYPELSGIVLVRAGDLPRLAGFADQSLIELMEGLSERLGAFVYGHARSARATVYYVCSSDEAGVEWALEHLLSRSASFTGLSLPPGTAVRYSRDSGSSDNISKRMPMARSLASNASPIASAGVSTP